MSELLANLALGFTVAATLQNVLLCFMGCLLGTLVGVLPGIGPLATIAMLLPLTFGYEPVSALILLAGIYYGAQYGSSTGAILLNLPGEVSSVVTAVEGHEMARRGRAGAALSVAAISSFVAGTFATFVIAALATPLTSVALMLGPPEYFSLMILGLIFAVALGRGSPLVGFTMVLVGALLSTVGSDLVTGDERLTFGLDRFSNGIEFALLGMGVFGLADVLLNMEEAQARKRSTAPVGSILVSRSELRAAALPMARGTLIGSLLGILPGSGAVMGSFLSFVTEKKLARGPVKFGEGAIEGVAGPEAANNAGAQTSFIPLLSLGLPSNAIMAMMVGAMMIHGVVPGPQIITKSPDLFWGLVASMWIGNLMLLVINLPLIGLWVKLLQVPYRILSITIVIICCAGAYSLNEQPTDVLILGGFCLFGYALIKCGFDAAPLALGFVLGRLLEESLRQTLLISAGSFEIFVARPISAAFLAAAAIMIGITVLPYVRSRRDVVFAEE